MKYHSLLRRLKLILQHYNIFSQDADVVEDDETEDDAAIGDEDIPDESGEYYDEYDEAGTNFYPFSIFMFS